jgi:hypothetical protein
MTGLSRVRLVQIVITWQDPALQFDNQPLDIGLERIRIAWLDCSWHIPEVSPVASDGRLRF